MISTNIFRTIRLTASSLAGSHSLDVETLIFVVVVVVSDFVFPPPPSRCSSSPFVWHSSLDGGGGQGEEGERYIRRVL